MSFHITGGCMCGALRYHAEVDNQKISACHCKMCLRWAGGPYFAVRTVSPPQYEDEGQLRRRKTSAWAERGNCAACGSNMFWHLLGEDSHNIAAGTIDNLADFSLAYEYFHDLKPSFYGFEQSTRQFTEAQLLKQLPDDQGD